MHRTASDASTLDNGPLFSHNTGVFLNLVLRLGLLAIATLRAPATEAEAHFHDKVWPLLESRCVSCHGSDKQKGGLRLDSREAALKGGELGPALLPGKPGESLLLQAVMHSKKDLEMPPKEKLSAREIEIFKRWISDGAPWPESKAPAALASSNAEPLGDAWSDPRNPIVRIFGGDRLDLWSLKPVQRPPWPTLRTAGPASLNSGLDAFVLASLEQHRIKFAPAADRRTLARRLYFDLTGLPPTPEQLDTFVRDRRPDAYARLVDQLLDSPRYGEHWARLWLDVVRYSDSNGFDWDEFRPKAWKFRDYVVRSLNADKPFDQFIREQLAGDELLDGPPSDSAEQDYLLATGYLRLGPHDNSAPLFNEQARSRAELMADLTETTGSAFLGLTLSCCRCHDHKFDPLSQADHFRMRAFFEGVKFADDLPIDLAAEQEAIRKHNDDVDRKLKPVETEKQELLDQVKARLRAVRVAKLNDAEQALLQTAADQRSEEQSKSVEALEKMIAVPDKEILESLTEPEKQKHEQLKSEIAALRKERREFTTALLMTDADKEPPVTRIHYQGDHKQERDAVQPGFISALDPNPAKITKGKNTKTTGRRLTLANWIASADNPLTARVLVNRIWQAYFGAGIVPTPNDFGLAGAKPTHPALLDWLASEFVRNGWSLKQLHRTIVHSATYQQASSLPSTDRKPGFILIGKRQSPMPATIDAGNQLLWRQNLKRLTAEQLRDSLLAVSGLMSDTQGGAPVWPELPTDVLTANPAFLDDNETRTKGWYPSPGDKQQVRGIYLVQKRTVRVPFMETFDLPENATSCPRRTESIVAPQALTLLNGDVALNAARALAKRVSTEAGSLPRDQVTRAFQLALQRTPSEAEMGDCLPFLERRGLVQFSRALLNVNEFIYVD